MGIRKDLTDFGLENITSKLFDNQDDLMKFEAFVKVMDNFDLTFWQSIENEHPSVKALKKQIEKLNDEISDYQDELKELQESYENLKDELAEYQVDYENGLIPDNLSEVEKVELFKKALEKYSLEELERRLEC